MSDASNEEQKYTEVWKHDEYRKVSPGMFEVGRASVRMGVKEGETLVDYGAGPGRATKFFADLGMHAIALDIAPNALETKVPFIKACLWERPLFAGEVDYGFCCDVMEHIPPQYVETVIENIAAHTRKFAWFRIATRPDVMGHRLIGEPLHLTIKTATWWRGKLLRAFEVVEDIRDDGKDYIALCSKTRWRPQGDRVSYPSKDALHTDPEVRGNLDREGDVPDRGDSGADPRAEATSPAVET